VNSSLQRLREALSSLRVHRRYRSTHRTRTRPTHTPHQDHTPHRTGPIRTPRTHTQHPYCKHMFVLPLISSITLPPAQDRPDAPSHRTRTTHPRTRTGPHQDHTPCTRPARTGPHTHTQDRTMQHHATHLLLGTHQTPLCIRGLAVWKSLLNAQCARRPREAPPRTCIKPPSRCRHRAAASRPGLGYDVRHGYYNQSRNEKRYPSTPPSLMRHHD
jgi:hypothetical protein